MKRTFALKAIDESAPASALSPAAANSHTAYSAPVPAPVHGYPADARKRLLDAALNLFGTRGFSETSVRDLAEAAHVNLAAVNYYFGSKDNLHIEALRYGFAPTTAVAVQLASFYDEARAEATTHAAEEALRRYVRLFLSQVLAEDHKHWDMILREQLTAGPAFKMAMKDYIEPLGEGLSGIVNLLSPHLSDRSRSLCVRSIIGQCVHLRYSKGIARYFNTKAGSPGNAGFIEESSAHIAEFSIQALRGMRSDYQKRSGGKPATTFKKPARQSK